MKKNKYWAIQINSNILISHYKLKYLLYKVKISLEFRIPVNH